MKSYINKFLAGAAILAMAGFTSCVGDLDQLPQDPNSKTANKFAENPRDAIAEVMAKCYSSLAVSGQSGPNGGADISGLDGGTSQWTRTIFMLEEFPTDECLWMYNDGGVDEMRWGTWGSTNVAIFGTYSRLYTHIAVCNDFLRLVNNPGDNGLSFPEVAEGNQISQAEVDQFKLEARALRDLSYYYVIDFFGDAARAWDDMKYGEAPRQTTRAALFEEVVADLEDVLANFNESGVYGRLSKDGVEALLCKYYLNAEVYTGTAMYDKCWNHCANLIARHDVNANHGLAKDYLSLFCANNRLFGPAGALKDQNEILWSVPQDGTYTQPWGGTTFLVNGAIKNMSAADAEILKGDVTVSDGYMNQIYYGTMDSWGCMHARPQFADKFSFVNGKSGDGRTYLWLTEHAGFSKENVPYNEFDKGYACIKYTAVNCNPTTGEMKKFVDPVTGLNRIGEGHFETVSNDGLTYESYVLDAVLSTHHDTNVPVIRLADVYLMAAECALRGAGNATDGLKYVNYIRERAGVPHWNSGELTLNSLLDERSRELYWENCRRTDLVRFNKFTGSSYLWSWKGGVETGTAYPSHFNIYPIPSDVIATYGDSYKQNPGY